MPTAWEYKIFNWPDRTVIDGAMPGFPAVEKMLNNHGEEGWEFVYPVDLGPGTMFVFMRPVQG